MQKNVEIGRVLLAAWGIGLEYSGRKNMPPFFQSTIEVLPLHSCIAWPKFPAPKESFGVETYASQYKDLYFFTTSFISPEKTAASRGFFLYLTSAAYST